MQQMRRGNTMTKGWKSESARHSLASRGVKTKGFEEDPQRMWNLRVMAHADAVQKAEKLAKKQQKKLQPFALKHEDVKEHTGETYQYDVLGQFYGEDRGGEKVGKLYQRYYKGREAAIVWMSPDEYFDKINKGYREKFPSGRDIDIKEGMDKEEVKKLADAMNAGDKFAMPWIDYRQDKFSGYEGKHRVAAAKLLGIEKIPIVVNNQISESEDHRAWMAAKERYGIKTD